MKIKDRLETLEKLNANPLGFSKWEDREKGLANSTNK